MVEYQVSPYLGGKASNCSIVTFYLHVVQVMRSITDNITEEKLLKEIDEITRLPMYADRMHGRTKMAQQKRR